MKTIGSTSSSAVKITDASATLPEPVTLNLNVTSPNRFSMLPNGGSSPETGWTTGPDCSSNGSAAVSCSSGSVVSSSSLLEPHPARAIRRIKIGLFIIGRIMLHFTTSLNISCLSLPVTPQPHKSLLNLLCTNIRAFFPGILSTLDIICFIIFRTIVSQSQ